MEKVICDGRLEPVQFNFGRWVISATLTIFDKKLSFLLTEKSMSLLFFQTKEEAQAEIDRIEER